MDCLHFRSSRADSRPGPIGFLLAAALAALLSGVHVSTVNAQSSDTHPPDTLSISSFEGLMDAVSLFNRELSVTAARAAALSEQTDITGTLPDPTVMLGASPFPVHTARGEQVLQLRVEQMLPWPGKRRLMREMAASEAEAADEDIRRLTAERTLEAVHAALAVVQTETLSDEVRDFRERLERFEQVALTRYETGQGDQQSIWKLQLAIAAQDQRLIQLAEDRETAAARISQVVHRPVSIPPGSFRETVPTVMDASPESRAEFRRLQQLLTRSRLAGEAARLQDRPDWGLSATWMAITESDIPASSDGRDALGLGVMVRIPLGRSEQRAREEQARLNESVVQYQIEAFEAGWQAQWNEAWSRLDGLMKRMDHLDMRLLPVAEAMLESSFQSYAAGTSGFLDLLDAERTAFDLRTQRVELQTRSDMTRWTLQRLAGHLESPSDHDLTR